MHRKSLEAQETFKDDSGVSDHEDSAGSKSNDAARHLTSSNESLNVVSPVPSTQLQILSPATTPTASSSPHIDLNSPPPTPKTPYATSSPQATQTLSHANFVHSTPTPTTAITPSYHPLLDAANASASVSTKDFHLIMNTAVAAAAAAAAASNGDHTSGNFRQQTSQVGKNINKNLEGAYAALERDPEAFRNNSIACLRAKAQEHQARLLNSGLLFQMRSMAEFQNSALDSSKTNADLNTNVNSAKSEVGNKNLKKPIEQFFQNDCFNNNYQVRDDLFAGNSPLKTTPIE